MADYHGRQSDDDNGRYSDEESGTCHGGGGGGGLREQDRLLPIANVSRIMKRALPANGKISKDAKETVQECVSEFISFVTGEASDKCQREKRKTVNGDDLLWAMATLGFEEYVDPLKLYLQRYREMEGEKTPSSTSGTATSSVSASMARRNDQDSGGSMGGNYLPNTQVYGHQSMNPLMYSQPYHMSMQNNNGGGPPGPPPGNAGGG